MVYQLYPALLLCAGSTAYNTGDASYGYGLAARAASAFASSSFECFVNICSLLNRLFPVLQRTHTVYLAIR